MKNHALLSLIVLSVFGCSGNNSPEEPSRVEVTDSQLYQMVLHTPKAAFYKNSIDTIAGNSGSAHPGNIIVWYNKNALPSLTTDGKVKTSASFQDSSLIVKEIFNNGERTAIAVLFKLHSAENAGANGWIWSEMDGSGNPLISAKDKGSGCSGCHSAGSTVDYTRMNDSHP